MKRGVYTVVYLGAGEVVQLQHPPFTQDNVAPGHKQESGGSKPSPTVLNRPPAPIS